MAECLGPQCAQMVLEWLKARAAAVATTMIHRSRRADAGIALGPGPIPGGSARDHIFT